MLLHICCQDSAPEGQKKPEVHGESTGLRGCESFFTTLSQLILQQHVSPMLQRTTCGPCHHGKACRVARAPALRFQLEPRPGTTAFSTQHLTNGDKLDKDTRTNVKPGPSKIRTLQSFKSLQTPLEASKTYLQKKKCQCVTFGIEAAVTQGQGRGEFEPGRQAGLSPAWPARHSCTPEVMDTLPSDSLRYSSLGYGCSSLHLRLLHILTIIVTWGKSGNKVKLACKHRATGIGCFAYG